MKNVLKSLLILSMNAIMVQNVSNCAGIVSIDLRQNNLCKNIKEFISNKGLYKGETMINKPSPELNSSLFSKSNDTTIVDSMPYQKSDSNSPLQSDDNEIVENIPYQELNSESFQKQDNNTIFQSDSCQIVNNSSDSITNEFNQNNSFTKQNNNRILQSDSCQIVNNSSDSITNEFNQNNSLQIVDNPSAQNNKNTSKIIYDTLNDLDNTKKLLFFDNKNDKSLEYLTENLNGKLNILNNICVNKYAMSLKKISERIETLVKDPEYSRLNNIHMLIDINNLYTDIKQIYQKYKQEVNNNTQHKNAKKEEGDLKFFELDRDEWKLMSNVFLEKQINSNTGQYYRKDITQYLKVNNKNVNKEINNTIIKYSENINILINYYNKLVNCVLNSDKLKEGYFTNSALNQAEQDITNISELYSQVFIPILYSEIVLSNKNSFSENYLDLANKISNCDYKQILSDYNEKYKNYIEILQDTLTNSYFVVKGLGSLVLGSYGVLEYSDTLKKYLKIKNMYNRIIEHYKDITKEYINIEKESKEVKEYSDIIGKFLDFLMQQLQ